MSEFIEYTTPLWRGLNMRQLKVDECYILLKSLYPNTTYLYTKSDECYSCPLTKISDLHTNEGDLGDVEEQLQRHALPLNVAHGQKFAIFENDQGQYAYGNDSSLCEFYRNDMQEFGVYNLTVHSNGTCNFTNDKPGVNVYLSLVSVYVLVALILALIKISLCAWRSYCYDEEAAAAAEISKAATGSQRKRMRSLDAFRGLAIVLMIFVNSGGGDYWWIEHAPWNGLHLADVVFPSFLWIMGVCIPISVASQMGRGATKGLICRRILWRSVKLFAIGLCLNSLNGPNLEKLRVMGVLQRFGIAYLVCGITHTVSTKNAPPVTPQTQWKRAIADLIRFKGEFVVMLSLVVTYLGITYGLDVPGCPKGYLGPGGKHANAKYPDCIGGAAGYIDLQVLGNNHIYQHPTAKYVYASKAFDPEGIFGCLLTVVQVLLGVLAGVIILVHTTWQARVKRWLCWSIALGLLGGCLCAFTKETGAIPINKNLWSLSFVCVTSSLAFSVLTFLYWFIDIRRWYGGFPFVECGMNAIILYVGHTVMHKMLPWHWRIGEMNTHFVLLLEAVWNTLLWVAIAIYLHSKQFYYSL